MKIQTTKSFLLAATAAAFLTACDTPSALVTVPVENVDSNPLKVAALTDAQEKAWITRQRPCLTSIRNYLFWL